MAAKCVWSTAALIAVISLGACGQKAAEAPARDHSAADLPTSVAPARETAANDPREAPIPKVDGKPMWSANRRNTAEENAQAHFERNGEAFGAKDVDAFVAMAHAFTSKPPAGTQRIKRTNGDTLLYDPKGNVFAVMTKDGAPRTMFKPDDGPAYWAKQKERETARAKGAAANEG